MPWLSSAHFPAHGIRSFLFNLNILLAYGRLSIRPGKTSSFLLNVNTHPFQWMVPFAFVDRQKC